MRRTRTNPKTGIAYRKAGTALAVAVTFALYPAFTRDAFAFKLFGVRLWGSEEPEIEVINPVKYAVTLNAADADKSLKGSLENSSLLLADKDKPASGDLGLLIKARDDRDRSATQSGLRSLRSGACDHNRHPRPCLHARQYQARGRCDGPQP
jgi:translocation and assembly module TamA